MSRLLTLLKNKKILISVVTVLVLLLLILFSQTPSQPFMPPVIRNEVPPVVVNTPEIKLISVEPPEGKREAIDAFTPTVFKFSVPINVNSLTVEVSPHIALKKVTFPDKTDTVLIEPAKTPWLDGVTYTITIKKGIIGVNGEELKSDISYSFSNTPPAYIELPRPI